NIGSERQTAVSDTVGTLAAGALLKKGDGAASEAGVCCANAPPKRPMGVRSGSQMTTSSGTAGPFRGRWWRYARVRAGGGSDLRMRH
ncbi:hypothetical protein AB0O63_13365, partial [Streptomyces cyaneofuscatus]|uniref:hypothetical protein n=1 Tax=Streptomyces cyaneofuscatus TaxID=66883 RepID=UPI00341911C9